ncbi:PDZ domain-containing protein 8-like isoform X2 [Daphnia pulicaria]|uniref:PDZ domain-containing protein 8-like isoform X2 n=1 Tax=Daphnia pulicaria TaxID=35523 RepID=UPI001EEB66C8|nr:PDZ domain-containing protein 8-like isoform X2 [Daphnia pulicaria]
MFLWLISTGLICFLLGIVLTLAVGQRDLLCWIMPADDDKLLPQVNPESTTPLVTSDQPISVELPEGLAGKLTAEKIPAAETDKTQRDETLLAVNLLLQFFFREAQNNGLVRRFLIHRINKEMQEGVAKGGATVNKIIKGLKIYDIEMGTKAPSIGGFEVNSLVLDEDQKLIESVDLIIHLEYSGGFAMGIDVALPYGKTAFLAAKLCLLKGDLRLKFSRLPYSHWTIAFSPPPILDMPISSRIQGQSYDAVTDLLASLITSWIQKQHCLPNSKMLTHPLFPDPDRYLLKPTPAPTSTPTRRGRLQVNVCDVSRLDPSLIQAEGLFCILALDSCPWIDFAPSEAVGHVLLDVRMIRKRDRPLGFVFHGLPTNATSDYSAIDEIIVDLVGNHPAGVVVVSTEPGSAADEAGFRAGDVILEVDGLPVNSVRQVLRAITTAEAKYVIIRIDRFIPAIKSKVEADDAKNVIKTGAEQRTLYPLPDDVIAIHRETIGRMVGLEMKRTETHPMSKIVHLGDTMDFRVSPGQRFLNLSIWLTGVRGEEFATTDNSAASVSIQPPKFSLSRLFKMKKDLPAPPSQDLEIEEPLKEVRLGYVNVSLAEIAADCHLNTQGHHVSTYQIYPADPQASIGQKHSLKDQDGFDPRLCYGDIVLSFVYQPDEEIKESQETVPSEETSPERSESSERHRSQVDVVIYELKRPHDWTLRRFGQLQNCDICQSKIWLGEGLYCPRCGLIIHKKCFKRIIKEDRKWCSVNQSIAKIDDYYISNVPIPVEGVKSDLEGNPFQVDEENEETNELESVLERLQARDHNESLVRMAKDSGRKLWNHLDVEKRRNKISSMLSKIEDAVKAETIRRYELAAEWERANSNTCADSGIGDSKWIEVELAASEKKRQALVLLELYFSVGWHDVEDALEQNE